MNEWEAKWLIDVETTYLELEITGSLWVCESAATRFLEELLDFDWRGVRLTANIKREADPEPLKIQKWQTSFWKVRSSSDTEMLVKCT